MRILAEERPTSKWLTTADVARVLERSPRGARWIVEQASVPCQRTPSGQRLFWPSAVQQLATQRMEARLRNVKAFRPKRLGVRGQPHQMSLFWKLPKPVPLKIPALPEAEVLRAKSRRK
jgi:hypothetical protein